MNQHVMMSPFPFSHAANGDRPYSTGYVPLQLAHFLVRRHAAAADRDIARAWILPQVAPGSLNEAATGSQSGNS